MEDAFYKRLQNDFEGLKALKTRAKGMMEFTSDPNHQHYRINLRNIQSVVGTTPENIKVSEVHNFIIEIPPNYPRRELPRVKFDMPIFHPNWFIDGRLCYGDKWTKNTTLAELVIDIIRMMQFEIINTKSPANQDAGKWFNDERNGIKIKKMIKLVHFPPPLVEDDALEVSFGESSIDDELELL